MRPAGIHVATEVSGKVVTACFRTLRGGALELLAWAELTPAESVPTPRHYRYALPPGSVWYRTLRVPSAAPRDRRRIVAFEAERAFPATGSDLVWDACRAPGPESEEGELVVGIRTDDVAARIGRLRLVGVCPLVLEPPGGPLHRYFCYMEPAERRPGILVDLLGATAQVMLVAGCRWTLRTISEASPAAGPSRLERIHLEIARLVSGLGGATAPAWGRVCGDAVGCESLRRDLELRLGIPVRLLDPLADGRVGLERVQPPMGEWGGVLPVLVGLALAPPAGGRVLDLLPRALRQQQARRRRRPALITASALVALSLGTLAVRAGQRAAEASSRADRLRQELPALLEQRRQLDLNETRLRRLEERLGRAGQLVHERDAWIRFLADLQLAVDAAGEAWIDRLERESDAEGAAALAVVIHGRMLDAGATGGRVSEMARQRVKALLASLGAASSVRRMGRERFTSGEPGVLQFELGVVLALGEGEARTP